MESVFPVIKSLAKEYFPASSPEDISNALFLQNDRKEGIIQDLRAIPNFPSDLIGPTSGVINFLELALDRSIHPYDGAAISVINTSSPDAMMNLGQHFRGDSQITIVVGQNRVVGRFMGEKESFVIDYQDGQEEPELIYHNDEQSAKDEAITKISEIDDPMVVLIKL